ncbi:MAG: DUF1552 domain-containing protein [Nannocystaceae bacterium]
MRNFKLSRRRMLRGMAGGASIAVGLPLLEAMMNTHGDALAGGDALPLRFMTWYWADGIVIDRWEPEQVGDDWQLSEQLAPLANVKDHVSVVSGMANRTPGNLLVTHHEGMAGLSGHPLVQAGGFNTNASGPTIDQVIADTLEGTTPIRAAHVRVSKRQSTDGDGGTNYIAMSHREQGGGIVAQTPQVDPQEVWQLLFGEFVPAPDDSDLRVSILDYVREDANALKSNLGTTDKQRVDAHLEGVYELEQKILATPPSCDLPDLPTETNTDTGGVEPISSTNEAMARLIAYAFVCDITRVASFQLKRFVSATVFDEIDAGEIHHNASHQGPGSATYQAGITYQMQKFADLLEIFAETEDLNGDTLLDTSIIYATSDCSTGASHSVQRQPILVAGGGRGYLRHPGIHYQTTPFNGNHNNPNGEENMSDVLLACLQAFDPTAESVGSGALESTTPLTDIVA